MSRLIGLLSWFEEDPQWLAASIVSFRNLGLDHLVCLDGAYEYFPDGRRRSSVDEYDALVRACHATGIGCTIQTPERLWKDEREKRDYLFMLAETVQGPGDWLVILDADEVVSDIELPLKQTLDETEHDVASIMLWERIPSGQVRERPQRKFFRAGLGLHVGRNHYTYMTSGGKALWGNQHHVDLEPVLDLTSTLRVEHRSLQRQPARRLRQEAYYRFRQESGMERGPCAFCDKDSEIMLPCNYVSHNGVVDYESVEVCSDHVERVLEANQRQLRDLHVAGDSIMAETRQRVKRYGLTHSMSP